MSTVVTFRAGTRSLSSLMVRSRHHVISGMNFGGAQRCQLLRGDRATTNPDPPSSTTSLTHHDQLAAIGSAQPAVNGHLASASTVSDGLISYVWDVVVGRMYSLTVVSPDTVDFISGRLR